VGLVNPGPGPICGERGGKCPRRVAPVSIRGDPLIPKPSRCRAVDQVVRPSAAPPGHRHPPGQAARSPLPRRILRSRCTLTTPSSFPPRTGSWSPAVHRVVVSRSRVPTGAGPGLTHSYTDVEVDCPATDLSARAQRCTERADRNGPDLIEVWANRPPSLCCRPVRAAATRFLNRRWAVSR
jgi:hypothetical protein